MLVSTTIWMIQNTPKGTADMYSQHKTKSTLTFADGVGIYWAKIIKLMKVVTVVFWSNPERMKYTNMEW